MPALTPLESARICLQYAKSKKLDAADQVKSGPRNLFSNDDYKLKMGSHSTYDGVAINVFGVDLSQWAIPNCPLDMYQVEDYMQSKFPLKRAVEMGTFDLPKELTIGCADLDTPPPYGQWRKLSNDLPLYACLRRYQTWIEITAPTLQDTRTKVLEACESALLHWPATFVHVKQNTEAGFYKKSLEILDSGEADVEQLRAGGWQLIMILAQASVMAKSESGDGDGTADSIKKFFSDMEFKAKTSELAEAVHEKSGRMLTLSLRAYARFR